jgi:riboflavin kinase/FMN adenylyltransferase
VKVISSIGEIPNNKKITLTLGNFDGVHLGHQKVIEYIVKKSKEEEGESLIVTFVPHPLLILKPQQNFLICPYSERRKYIEDLGVDYIYEINFTRDLSLLGPGEFLDKYIYNASVKNVFLGHDFSFGANKQGNYDFVKSYFSPKSIQVHSLDEFNFFGNRVSSTQIRNLIKDGDVLDAAKVLGRHFVMHGRIKKGLQRGAQLGFPTANLDYDDNYVVPKEGVYITQTKCRDKNYYSVTNIGINPTFGDVKTLQVETHIMDFDKDIYGEEIQVEFIKRLRDEKKFSSVDELKLQIALDVKTAYQYLKND